MLGLSLFGMAEAAAVADCGGTCDDVCGGEPVGPIHDYVLPLPTTRTRKLSAPGAGPPAEITITTMGLTPGNLIKMVLRDARETGRGSADVMSNWKSRVARAEPAAGIE